MGPPEYEAGMANIIPQRWDKHKRINVYRSYIGLFKLFVYTHNVPAICRNILRKTGICFSDLGSTIHEIWNLPTRIQEVVLSQITLHSLLSTLVAFLIG